MGDVFYGFNQSVNGDSCYIKTSGVDGTTGWIPISKATNLSSSDITTATTNDPGPTGDKHRPPIGFFSAVAAARLCQGHTTEYGSKRLLRRREFLVASPLPYIAGEDNAILSSFKVFDAPQITNVCSISQSMVTGATASAAISSWLSSSNARLTMVVNSVVLAGEGNHPYFIGADPTKTCVSRFGIQDPFGFAVFNLIVSDTFVRTTDLTTLPATLVGTTSDYDSGALDFNGVQFNGLLVPNQGVSNGSTYYFTISDSIAGGAYPCSANKTISSFIPPLGLPICTWSGSPQSLRNITEIQRTAILGAGPLGASSTYNLGYPPQDTTTTTYSMSVGGSSNQAGRWSYGFSPNSTQNYASHALLCAIEAE